MYAFMTVFGILLTFLTTALGASAVFLFKGDVSPKANAVFLGFASGIMLAASVWSLLLPALSQTETYLGRLSFLPVAIGFLFGGAFLALLDKCTVKLRGKTLNGKLRRLFLAVTLHNIPEGLAVGFAFGAAAMIGTAVAYFSALGLAIGIAVQNFPEGAAISLPMKNEFQNNKKSFLWGASSGLVEPIFATVGYFLATSLKGLQPWLLAFSAGTMVFVTAHDLIPDSRVSENFKSGAWGVMLGFVLMMTLDVALG